MGFTAAAEVGADVLGSAATDAAATGAVEAGAADAAAGGLAAGAADTGAAATGGSLLGDTSLADLGTQNAAAAAQEAAQTGAYNIPATAPSSLSDILGYAKTGAQIVGGLGKIAGGIGSMQAGQKVGGLQADPFAQYRPGLASQLNQLLTSPQTVTQTPGYQFNLSQGLQGLQAQQAAQGRLVSGGALLQGQQFGQQLAGQTYQQQLQNLASLSGATQSPASGAGAQAGLISGQLGGQLGGLQSIAQGLGVATGMSPLDTLYSNYNKSSPSVQGA